MSGGDNGYSFKYCTSAADLREAYHLRLEVFHAEQGFPEETEVDDYDPISAHFILVSKQTGKTAATVRLTPYPQSHHASATTSTNNHDPQPGASGEKIAQNDTAIVTSGGGPGGSSGGLAMSVSSSSRPSASADQPAPHSTKEYHTGIAPEHESAGLISNTDKDMKMKRQENNGFPLGGPQSESSLAHDFMRHLKTVETEGGITTIAPERGAKLSRLAVRKSERGNGLGAIIVRHAEAWLMRVLADGGGELQGSMGPGGERRDVDKQDGKIVGLTIFVSSQMPVKAFYEKLSYTPKGEPYDEEGAPHIWCTKRLVYEAGGNKGRD